MTRVDTVDALIEQCEKKLELLKEWKECHLAAVELADGGCFTESDHIYDDRCIEIEEYFEEEYNIKFDSYGDMYED